MKQQAVKHGVVRMVGMALWLLAMGRTYYGAGGRNEAERRALAGVVWPPVEALRHRKIPESSAETCGKICKVSGKVGRRPPPTREPRT